MDETAHRQTDAAWHERGAVALDLLSLDPGAWISFIRGASDFIDPQALAINSMTASTCHALLAEKPVAVRLLAMTTVDARRRGLREWQRWRQIHHPNIVSLIGVSFLLASGRLHLALISSPAPSLVDLKRCRPLGEVVVAHLAAGVANALSFIHGRRMIHGDICPETIVVNARLEAQLIGFGDGDDTGFDWRNRHPSLYSAPEIADLDIRGPFGYSCRVDVWALGAILCDLLGGSLERPSAPASTSPVLNELIDRCLDLSPRRRPAAIILSKRLAELASGSLNVGILRTQAGRRSPRSLDTLGRHRALGIRTNSKLVKLHGSRQLDEGDAKRRLQPHQALILKLIFDVLGCGKRAAPVGEPGETKEEGEVESDAGEEGVQEMHKAAAVEQWPWKALRSVWSPIGELIDTVSSRTKTTLS